MRHPTLIAILLAACVSASGHAAELVIGNPSELSGANAPVGQGVARGVLVAAEEINATKSLGTDTVRILQEDEAGDRAQTMTLVNRFAIGDKALAIVGPVSTIVAMAAAPRANDLQIPMLAGAYAAAVLNAGPWIFKVTETSENMEAGMAEYAIQRLHPKRCFMVFVRDNEGYVALKNTFRDKARAGGIELVGEESSLSTDSDFTAIATKVVNSKADCLQVNMPTEAAANVVVQTRAAGFPASSMVIAGSAEASPAFIRVGGPAVEGTYVFSDYAFGGINDLGRNFEKLYQAEYHETPDNWAAVGYAAMQLMAEAIRKAQPNPTREKIRAALASTNAVPTILGHGRISFDAAKVPHYGASILRVQGGKFVPAD